MRKLFWTIVLVGGYVWVISSGREDLVFQQGKAIYKMIVEWFDDATIEFNVKNEKPKKRYRRWD